VLQADGSGLYSVQALWSQARENARVVTIVCANRSYAILKVEMAKQRIVPRWVLQSQEG
jgi:acetolactate synthase-1/2/3 large subunit